MSTTTEYLLAGAVAGLSIAMPVGPLALLCIQRSLRWGFAAGFGTGLGGVAFNTAFGALLLFGLRNLLPALDGGSRTLGTLGGAFLLWSAVRVLRRPAFATPAGRPVPALCWPTAFLSAFGYNATNPLGLVLLLASLSPAIGAAAPDACRTAALLAGLALAASAWWACVSLGASLLRTRLSPALLIAANRLAGVLLSFYGALALLRAWAF